MPQLSTNGVPLLAPNGTPFTGGVVLSQSPGGCNTSANCTIVTFRNGIEVAGFQYSAYMMSPQLLTLPVTVPAGVAYYNQIPGDPQLIACDPSKMCGTMLYKTAMPSGPSTWSQVLTGQINQVASTQTQATNDELIQVKADLLTARSIAVIEREKTKACRAKIAQLEAQILQMQRQSTATSTTAAASTESAKPGETAKLIGQLDLSCPPALVRPQPKPDPKPAVGCCGEVDSVSGFLDGGASC